MVFLSGMELNSIQNKFCKSIKAWFESSYGKHGDVSKIAKELKLSQGYFSNIKAGRRCPDENERRRIAKSIGLNYEKMIGLKSKASPAPETQKQTCEPCKLYNYHTKTNAKVIKLDNEKYVIGDLLDMARDVLTSDHRRSRHTLAYSILSCAEKVHPPKKESKHKKTLRNGNSL